MDELHEDPIVQAVEPATEHADALFHQGRASAEVGTMKTVMMQVLESRDAVPF